MQFLKLLKEQRDRNAPDAKGSLVTVDLHPDRPIARGIAPPPYDKTMVRLPDDPTFDDMEALGATLDFHREGHVVGEGTVWVSGEIPRVTEFEPGLRGFMRWVEDKNGTGKWTSESVCDTRITILVI